MILKYSAIYDLHTILKGMDGIIVDILEVEDNPGDDKKDIPIKRPPTREELKKIRPRMRLIFEYKNSRPSTCALGNSYDEAEWLDEREGDNGED